jgi:capsid assembly protease
MSKDKENKMENQKQETTENFINNSMNVLSSDWAITKDGFATVKANFDKIKDIKAVEAYNSASLEKTLSVKIRDGVAIIPVTGPIFRYVNWYMYYFGGTAISWLARDFQAALDNKDVYSILFNVNSPGGECNGVNEFCKMVLGARNKKPMTAYVGGLGCSAGYWIPAMAGDIVVDETAILGSIGVQTVYLDDTKFLENMGFEEIVLTSDISPKKNLPPTDDEGKKLVKNRLNALANVFASSVGIGRGIPLKTVLRDFGQGDVFVGQEAIDAGLADRIGSFEETLALLANAHSPEFVIGDSATLKINSDLALETADAAISAEQNITDENSISEDNMNDTENKTTAAQETEKPAAQDMVAQADFAAMQKRAEDAERQLETEKAQREEAEAKSAKTALEAEMKEIAKDFAGDRDKKTEFLCDLADKFGKDSAQFKAYVEDQKALASQDEASELFKEQGKTGAGTDVAAMEQIQKMANDRAAKDGITPEQAMVKVAEENPELYARYEKGE